MNADEVGEELEMVIQTLNCTIKVLLPVDEININSLSKEDRVAKLKEHRKTYFQKDPTAKSRLVEEAKRAFRKVYPDKVDRLATNLSMSKLIDLSQRVKDMARYS